MTKEETLETLYRVSRPLMYTDNIWIRTFLIDLQAEISSFCCRIFHHFAYFSKFSSIIIGFYVL